MNVYAYLSGSVICTLPNTGAVATNYVSLQQWLLAQTIAAVTTYLHTDQLGSPIAATNDSGALLWYEKYQPYGLKLMEYAMKLDLPATSKMLTRGLTDMQARPMTR